MEERLKNIENSIEELKKEIECLKLDMNDNWEIIEDTHGIELEAR